ncbi:MAG: HNH endonuclease [Gemmatimonadaceae bacterium]|nr:HNH endonuclease [Gemmatimonadaceae bacterium]
MDKKEEWRISPSYADYEISSKARVRRRMDAERYPGRILSQTCRCQGYAAVQLRPLVHRLVAEAFLGKPKPGYVVNHIDGNKEHNLPENLEWVTPNENVAHAFRTGLNPTGNKHHKTKLSDAQVIEIRKAYTGSWGQQSKLAREYGVTQVLISKIVRGEIRAHLAPEHIHPGVGPHRGGEHGRSKLKEDDVRTMRERYADGGVSQQQLAEEYGLRPAVVHGILRHRTWKHVTLASDRPGARKLDDNQCQMLRQRYAQGGVTQQKLADECGVSRELVSQILRGIVRTKHVAPSRRPHNADE